MHPSTIESVISWYLWVLSPVGSVLLWADLFFTRLALVWVFPGLQQSQVGLVFLAKIFVYLLHVRFYAFVIYEFHYYHAHKTLPHNKHGDAAARALAHNRTMHSLNGNIFGGKGFLIFIIILIILTAPTLFAETFFHYEVRKAAAKAKSRKVAVSWIRFIMRWIQASHFGVFVAVIALLISPILFVIICVITWVTLVASHIERARRIRRFKAAERKRELEDEADRAYLPDEIPSSAVQGRVLVPDYVDPFEGPAGRGADSEDEDGGETACTQNPNPSGK